MKICPYCRNQMATGQTICDMCGETVLDVEMAAKKSIVLKPRKPPEQVANTMPDLQSSDKKYKTGLIILFIISGVIVLGGVALALMIFL